MKIWTDKEKTKLFMRRFKCRDDVYGKKSKSGKGPFPVCQNFLKVGCNVPEGKPNPCRNCSAKLYEPVTEQSVLRHIKGREGQIFYVLHLDGTVDFSLVDFDCKPGKESEGYTFEDVERLIAAFKEWGIHFGIARSTGNGFHVYIFIDGESYPAVKIRAIISSIFEMIKINVSKDGKVRIPPEVFPKQSQLTDGGIGNGAKLPPIEASFIKERNCWVTEKNEMIPADQQWSYFESIQSISGQQLDKIIEEKEISISERSFQDDRKSFKEPDFEFRQLRRYEYPRESLNLVFKECEAFSALAKKAKHTALGYAEGFCLFSLAMNFRGGRSWFAGNVLGWDESQKDSSELSSFEAKGVCFHTCKNLQSHGICRLSREDACLSKKYHRGKLASSPSPIRFARGETNLRTIFRRK